MYLGIVQGLYINKKPHTAVKQHKASYITILFVIYDFCWLSQRLNEFVILRLNRFVTGQHFLIRTRW